MTRRSRTARRIALLAAVVLLAGVGAAAGYWTGGGTGSGKAQVASQQMVVLSAGTPSAQLSPGHATDVAVVASNPNPFPVRIASLVIDTEGGSEGFQADAGHSTCDLSSLSFTSQDNGGAGWSVPARSESTDGTLAITLPGSLAMAAAASNSCQGALFAVYLKAGP